MPTSDRLLLPVLMLSLTLAGPASAESADPAQANRVIDAPEIDRLAGLCTAWTTVKLFHPWMFSGGAERNRDWDRAFVEAVPAVRAAESTEGYRGAVGRMLRELEDPVTEVTAAADEDDAAGSERASNPGPPSTPEEPPPLFRHPATGIVLIDLAGYQAAAGPYPLLEKLWLTDVGEELAEAKGVVVDLRIPPETPLGNDLTALALDRLAPRLVPPATPREARGPIFRWPVHWGYRPQRGSTSGGYHSGFVTSHARVFSPRTSSDGTAAPLERLVFLTSERTSVPELALALRGAGLARIVGEAPLSEARLADTLAVDLGDGVTATVRATELVPTTSAPLEVDLLVEPGSGSADPALDRALELLEEPFSPTAPEETAATVLPAGIWRPEETYPEMGAPDAPHRMLAACRLWGTIEHFYPYLHLIGDWEASFREAIPEFLAEPPPGEAEEAYVRAVLRFAAEIEDSHTGVWGGAVSEVRGAAGPPLSVREIEGRWAITEVLDRTLEERLRVGDVVHAIDGVPVEERLAATWPLVTASTEVGRRQVAIVWAMRGEEGTSVRLTVSGADGEHRTVSVLRGRPEEPVAPDEAMPFRLLEGEESLGYVDLRRLEVPQVPGLFEALGDTDGLIFDLRGYPRGTAWAIAPRLNDREAEIGARVRRREVSRHGFGMPDHGYFFAEPLPESGESVYRGEIVVLVDVRTISQAEYTALFFEAAADVTFVGTPTAGANGDVTNLMLPGGLRVNFSGHDIRWPDGRQLQRVGVIPDIEATPTLAGLRAGEDEVLATGIEVLRDLVAGNSQQTEEETDR